MNMRIPRHIIDVAGDFLVLRAGEVCDADG